MDFSLAALRAAREFRPLPQISKRHHSIDLAVTVLTRVAYERRLRSFEKRKRMGQRMNRLPDHLVPRRYFAIAVEKPSARPVSMLLSAELLAFRCGFYSLEGTFIWKRTCDTIAGLNDETGIARREVDRRGRRDTAAEKLRGCRFSFRFNHQRIQMANAEGKLTSGDRSRKLALDMSLDQLIKS